MPNMSGWDTYLALKQVRPGLKAIMVTGYSVDDYISRCLEFKDVPIIEKPFNGVIPNPVFWGEGSCIRRKTRFLPLVEMTRTQKIEFSFRH